MSWPTPSLPASSRRRDMLVPSRSACRKMSECTSGASGSACGGTNMRGPVLPIWCSSRKACGNQRR